MSELHRSDGGVVVLALAIVAAGGTLLLTLSPAGRWLLPVGALALAAYLFIARERRIRRRLRALGPVSGRQALPPVVPRALLAAPHKPEDGSAP